MNIINIMVIMIARLRGKYTIDNEGIPNGYDNVIVSVIIIIDIVILFIQIIVVFY